MIAINLNEAARIIQDASRILLVTHIQPDGDAIGSLLAAGQLLSSLGKQVTLACHNQVPKHLRILPGWQEIRLPEELSGSNFDLVCSLDASDLERLGDAASLFQAAPATLVIDHHASNTMFGKANYIDSKVAATGNLVYRLFALLQVPVNAQAAACIYTALSTDTGNFSFGQIDAEFFAQLSGLMAAGLDLTLYSRALHLVKEPSFIRLLARALASLQFHCEGRLSSMVLSNEDFIQTGANPDMTEGLVNYALNIAGVKMCFLASQQEDGQTKFSLRAIAPYNVASIATQFGGGGHLLAAGCTVNLPLETAVEKMKASMEQAVCL